MLTDVFEYFQNMFLEIYELDPTRFFTAPRLAWQAAFKNTKVKLDIISTDIDKFLMIEKCIRGGICHINY